MQCFDAVDFAHLGVLFNCSKYVSFHQWTPLHVAAERGCMDVLEYLVDKEADIHIKDTNEVCT